MTALLKIYNDFSYLTGLPQEIDDKLYEKLAFRKEGYYHSSAYRQHLWDGFTRFYSKSGKFLTGLLPEVYAALTYYGVNYQTIDDRDITQFTQKTIDKDFLNKWIPKKEKKFKELYDYQVDLVNQAIKYKRGIIQAPTGSGKTNIIICLMHLLPPKTPILFLANRKLLVKQTYDDLIQWGVPNVGRLNSDYHDPNLITCVNVQSIHHIQKLLPKFKAVIADEIHMLSNKSGISVFKKLTGATVRIAVSATPFKSDKVQKYTVKGYFGPVFKTSVVEGGVLTVNYLQGEGNLSKSVCTFYPIIEPQLPYEIWQDAVDLGLARNVFLHNIVNRLTKKLKGRTLILVERIVHGDMLNSLISNSLWVRGKDNEESRQYVIDKLKYSKEDVVAIATRQIFDTGVNLFVHNVINNTDVSAEHIIKQLTGRGLRPADDKEILQYFDFVYKINPYLEDHSNERIKVLKKEKHKVIVKDSIDF